MNSKQLLRIGAIGGILSVVFQMTGQMLIQIGGMEPPFNAGAAEIQEFFAGRDPQLAPMGGFISLLGFIPFLWFLGVLWRRLRQSEPGPGWLSVIVLGSGLMIVAVQLVSGTGWAIAFMRLGETTTPELARFQFDFGNFLFAISWVMMASLLLAAGVLSIAKRALPKWIGWFGMVVALALCIATANWFSGSDLLFIPVTGYWIWLIIVSVVLLRNPDVTSAAE